MREIPEGPQWQYEPKWDGFRCLAFRDGGKTYLQSKAGQPLGRYFPELVKAVSQIRAEKFVLDGEIAVPVQGTFSFDDLLQRIHPAASRITRLSEEHPATFIVFDLLVRADGQPLVEQTLKQRREELEKFASKFFVEHSRLRLSPATRELTEAKQWFKTVGGDLDGIIAKRLDFAYDAGERNAMEKVKAVRTADCVIGGFRYASRSKVIGSLLLGLFDDAGLLHHVGFCSGLKAGQRRELVHKLKPLIQPPGFTGQAPGGPSRWSTDRSTQWEPLKPVLVIEVSYDHFTSGRFRHGTKLLRWRPDKSPRQCKMDQVYSASQGSLKLLL